MHSSFPPDFKPEFPRVIDSTMNGTFINCPREFFETFILKRSKPGGSVHLIAGGAYAKGLEVVRTLVYGPERLPLDDAIAEAIPHIFAEYGDFKHPEDYGNKSAINVVRAVVAYFDKYHPDRDHIRPLIKQNGMPAVEFTFTIPMEILHPDTKEPILYAGRFDMVGIYQGLPWVVDDKTATQLGTSWDRSWRLRGQLTGYTYAARLYGIEAQGAIVRGTSFIKAGPDGMGAFGFSEPIEYRPNWQLERWWVQLHRNVARMVQCWEDRDEENPYGYWDYALADACNAFGGCPFMDLCVVSNPDQWAETGYEYRDWSPLDRNPGGRPKIQSAIFSS